MTPRPTTSHLSVPTQWVGPIQIESACFQGQCLAPLSTFESPLWPSVQRGAKLSCLSETGIAAVITKDCMTRSVVISASSAITMHTTLKNIRQAWPQLKAIVEATSRHIVFIDCEIDQVGNLAYLRLVVQSGQAAGHNMVTKAADAMLQWLIATYPALEYVSISGNICADKKNAAINGLRGRGKEVIAELMVSKQHCETVLKTTPAKIHDLHIKKNLLGSNIAGSLRSANAHFANMLLAIYLATGQDAANIIEGSQGFTHTEIMQDNLYFSVTLPNLIVGTVGNGKHHTDVLNHLAHMGCDPESPHSAQKLAIITAAVVLCGELSLLAAQTNPGELMRAHLTLERARHRHTIRQKPTLKKDHL